MQAYKLKGTIDEAGNLIITEPIHLQPGEVEVIVLQPNQDSLNALQSQSNSTQKTMDCKTNAFRDLLAIAQPIPSNFNPDQAQWEVLKEKHKLDLEKPSLHALLSQSPLSRLDLEQSSIQSSIRDIEP